MPRRYLFAVLLGCWTGLIQAAPFQNLGFDQADTSTLNVEPGPVLRGTGPAEDLLPGWQLSLGNTPQSTIGLNLDLLAFGYATLISADQSGFYGFPVEGAFALRLVGATDNDPPFTLRQRGDLPPDAQFLSYRFADSALSLSINGTTLDPVGRGPNSEVFDVSRFAGQTVDLALTTLNSSMPGEASITYLDSVALGVPEPSTISLALLGLGALVLRRIFKRRTSP